MKYRFNITGLDCPHCAEKLSAIIANHPDVESAKINFLTEKITVESPLDEDAVFAICADAGRAFNKAVSIAK